jgi:HEAT repeat protein
MLGQAMQSIFNVLPVSSPAETVTISLIATAIGIGLLISFILLRRALRKRHFQHRDQRIQYIRDNWERILSEEVRIKDWFSLKIDRDIVEEILLHRLATADSAELPLLREFARHSGLRDRKIHQVRKGKGWGKRLALIALGRMQLPESIPALSEALQDRHDGTVVDAIRGLGYISTPEAAQAILRQVSRKPQQCPPQTVQAALAQCYRSDPELLLGEVREANDALRPILTRVLAEVADRRLTGDLMELALDPLAEVRASSARIIAVVHPSYALNVLSMLAGDSEWFVRLRAVVAIGELGEKRGIPLLVQALCDRNRLVRLRAASQLLCFRGEENRVIQLVLQTEDRYALQALISDIERSGRLPEMVNGLAADVPNPAIESVLLAVLQNGFTSILADLLLNHPDRRVCIRLARILAKSGDTALLKHLVQIHKPDLGLGQQKLLGWAIAHLKEAIITREAVKEAVSA